MNLTFGYDTILGLNWCVIASISLSDQIKAESINTILKAWGNHLMTTL